MASTSGPTLKDNVRKQRQTRRVAAREELHAKSPASQRLLVEFQPDAVEIEQAKVPGGLRWTLYTVIGLLISAVAWACWAEVDKIVTAPGKLITSDQPIIIQTPSTAPIRSMQARFGDIVRAGDILATLDPTFSAADLAQLEQKLQSLEALIARLTAEQNRGPFDLTDKESRLDWVMQNVAFVERKKEFDSKIAEFQAEYDKVVIQQANNKVELETEQGNLVDLVAVETSMRNLNEKDSVSDVKYLSAKIQVNGSRAKVAVHQGKEKEFTAEMDSISKRREAYIAGWQAEISKQMLEAVEKKLASEEELKKARRTSELVELRVPTDQPHVEYYVQEVADRSVGSVVQPGEALFKLTPLGAPLEVELEIPAKDISNVRVGNDVRIKLSTFPYQKNGWLEGTIRTISESSFEKESSPGAPPITTFRARITLNESQPNFRVKDYRLLPGMLADSDVKVGKRRVIEYILYPLMGAVDSSIREP